MQNSVSVEIRGQVTSVGFLFPLFGAWESNMSLQACQQEPLPDAPSHWSHLLHVTL